MVEHSEINEAMNCKQVLLNLTTEGPIKNIIEAILRDSNSRFNPSCRYDLDDITTRYVMTIKKLNEKVLDREPEEIEADLIAQTWLKKESIKSITKSNLKNSLELFILNRNNVVKVEDLIGNEHMYANYVSKIDDKYKVLLEATKRNRLANEPESRQLIYLKGRYKPSSAVSSRAIRLNLHYRIQIITPKLALSQQSTEVIVRNIRKITSIRLRTTLLRNLHGDVFTKDKLWEKGLIDSNECEKCGQPETHEHLLHECWYSARTWKRLINLYQLVDRRPQAYRVSNDFVMGLEMIRPRINLHLEIIRLLECKTRPTMLPASLLKTALTNLIVSERVANDRFYLMTLASNLGQ